MTPTLSQIEAVEAAVKLAIAIPYNGQAQQQAAHQLLYFFSDYPQAFAALKLGARVLAGESELVGTIASQAARIAELEAENIRWRNIITFDGALTKGTDDAD